MSTNTPSGVCGLRPFSDVVEIPLAAGGSARGVIVWYRGAGGPGLLGARKFVGVKLLAAPDTVVPCDLAACRPTGLRLDAAAA